VHATNRQILRSQSVLLTPVAPLNTRRAINTLFPQETTTARLISAVFLSTARFLFKDFEDTLASLFHRVGEMKITRR
jgi:hypothetical protein